jgi:hypothetical protein
MRTTTAAAGSAVFLVIAPGVVAGLVPWWLTRWQMGAAYPVPVRVIGAVAIGVGAAALLGAFVQFAIQGRGTPAPPAPTEQLVVRGLYRYVRNPMYLAVLAVITGQAILLGRPVLLGYGGLVGAAFIAFVSDMNSPPWPAVTAPSTRPTGGPCPDGGPACDQPAPHPRPDRAPCQLCHRIRPGARPAGRPNNAYLVAYWRA